MSSHAFSRWARIALSCVLTLLLATWCLESSCAQEQFPEDPPMPAHVLPNPLQPANRAEIKTAEQWTNGRRDEILELFRTNVYGRVPATTYDKSFEVIKEDARAMNGDATLRQIAIRITRGSQSLTVNVNLFIPNRVAGPVPAFVLICNRGPENIDASRQAKSEFWPAEQGIARGYAMAAFLNSDVDPDRHDGFHDGIHGLLDDGPRSADAWGTIAAWAWGASRVLDYLETVPQINARQVAVIGHSRGGKTALWAAAEDQRFAMAISNDSGCGGASLSRRRFAGKEQVARIVSSFPHWFCSNFARFAEREDELPVDQHELIALIAPRAVAVGSAAEDRWADPRGEFLSVVNAAPVFALFGQKALGTTRMPPIGGAIHGDAAHYHLRSGKHNLTLDDWQHYWDFADRVFERTSRR
jgi:pimeloyl-ACP methyl ester carboxylesterase